MTKPDGMRRTAVKPSASPLAPALLVRVFLGLGVLCVLMAAAVFTVVPESVKKPVPEPFSHQIQGVIQVFQSLTFWRIAPLTMLSQAGFMAVQGLWAGPWLRDVMSLDRTDFKLSSPTVRPDTIPPFS